MLIGKIIHCIRQIDRHIHLPISMGRACGDQRRRSAGHGTRAECLGSADGRVAPEKSKLGYMLSPPLDDDVLVSERSSTTTGIDDRRRTTHRLPLITAVRSSSFGHRPHTSPATPITPTARPSPCLHVKVSTRAFCQDAGSD